MSQKFEPGELVNVRIDGVRYAEVDQDGHHVIEMPDARQFRVPETAVIERVAPKEWPPQPGDIWEDHNRVEWLAVASHTGTVKLVASHSYDDQLWPQHALEQSGWRLVRRRDWTPDPAPDEPAPVEVDRRAEKVAGLRAFADLLESRPDVPLPYGINGQVGFRGEEGLAEALRLAASLGVELDAGHDTGHEVQRWARSAKLDLGADVTLTLYAHGLDSPPEPPDCCPNAEPDDPAEVGGETVEDAEAES